MTRDERAFVFFSLLGLVVAWSLTLIAATSGRPAIDVLLSGVR